LQKITYERNEYIYSLHIYRFVSLISIVEFTKSIFEALKLYLFQPLLIKFNTGFSKRSSFLLLQSLEPTIN